MIQLWPLKVSKTYITLLLIPLTCNKEPPTPLLINKQQYKTSLTASSFCPGLKQLLDFLHCDLTTINRSMTGQVYKVRNVHSKGLLGYGTWNYENDRDCSRAQLLQVQIWFCDFRDNFLHVGSWAGSCFQNNTVITMTDVKKPKENSKGLVNLEEETEKHESLKPVMWEK